MRARIHWMITAPIFALCLVALLAEVAPASDSSQAASRTRMEQAMRQSVEVGVLAQQEPSTERPALGGEVFRRMGHASWSLMWPGWSQFRSGHRTRGFFFSALELGIWSSYTVFQVQGHTREDKYREYAVQFAALTDKDQGDDYWRSVGKYRSSEEYNEDVRRDLRVGLDPDGPEYTGDEGWRWQSEQRFLDYQDLRRDSNEAFDNATLVLLFALINRAAAFADAVRSGPSDEEVSSSSPEGVSIQLGLQDPRMGRGPALSLHQSF